MEARGEISTVWFDNLTNIGPLFKQQSQFQTCYPLSDISNFLNEEG